MKKQQYLLTASEEKRIAKEHLRQRVLKAHDNLINAQMSIALGSHYLFKITFDPDTNRKSKPQLVTDPKEMEDYLAGNTDQSTEYYFLMAEKPDNRAIDSLFDRAFGKPQTPTEDQPDATDDMGVIAYPTLLPSSEELSNLSQHDQISLEAPTDTDTSPTLSS